MSEVGRTEAQAPVTEAVVDDTKVAVTSEETKAEEVKAEPEGDVDEPETDDASQDGAEKVEGDDDKPSKAKQRRERQKAHIAALEAEVKRLSELTAATERTKPAADALGPKPSRDKFEDEADYIAATASWTVRKDITEHQTKTYETNSSTVRSDTAAKRMELFKERALTLTDRYPDIEAKVFNDNTLPMSAVMAETLMASEKGPEVAYWLSANRNEAQRIKSLSPGEQAFELGRIAATVSLPKPRTETKAPPPPSTVSGTVRGPSKNPETMSQAEYVAWRNNGGGEKRTG